MRFVLITAAGSAASDRLFEAACRAAGVDFTAVLPGSTSSHVLGTAHDGRLLYCAATDRAAQILEKLLCVPGVAALHDPHFICDHEPLLLAQSGLPMPRAVFVPAAERDRRETQIAWLGGWPVVVKRAGLDTGRGIFRADEMDTLDALLAAPGGEARIERYIPHRRCWRVTVLGGQVLAASAQSPAPGDFRSNAPGCGIDWQAVPPPGLAAIATSALAVLRLEFGGVDIIEGEDGRLWLCEVNFPCSFIHQQQGLGIDIAGAIVRHLQGKLVQAGAATASSNPAA